MEAKRLLLNLPPGLYQAGTKQQAEGRWYDGHLTRFFEKTVRSVGGWRRLVNVNNVVVPPVGGTGGSEGGGGGGAGGAESGAIPRKVIAWSAGGATSAKLMAVGAIGPIGEDEGGPGDGTDDHAHRLMVYREGIPYDITPEGLANAYVNDESDPGEEELRIYRYHFLTDGDDLEVTQEITDATILVVGTGGASGTGGLGDTHTSQGLAGGGSGGECPDPSTGVTLTVGTHPVVIDTSETTFFGLSAGAGSAGGDGSAAPDTGAGGAGGAIGAGGSGGKGGAAAVPGPSTYPGAGGGGGGAGGVGGAGAPGTDDPPVSSGNAGAPKVLSGYGSQIDGSYCPGGKGAPNADPQSGMVGAGANAGYAASPGIVIVRYRLLGNSSSATGGTISDEEE